MDSIIIKNNLRLFQEEDGRRTPISKKYWKF